MSLMRIDDLFHFEKGSLQSSKCTEGEFDFITASSEWKTHNEYTHDCEALVFAAAASGSLGRTHYVNGKFIASDLCFIITPKNQSELPIDLKFYHMIFNEFKDDIVKNTKAGTSKEAIGLKAFGNYKLPYFNIDKQVEAKNQFVNMQESKVELNIELSHQLDLIKQLRQAFLREAMQGKLCHAELVSASQETGHDLLAKIKAEKTQLIAEKKLKKEKELSPITVDEIPFEIPEHWAWCRLGEICLKVTDGFHNTPPKVSKGFPYIAATQVKSDKIDWDNCNYVEEKFHRELYTKTTPKKGEILVVNIGAGCGTPAIIDVDFEFSFKNTAILKFNQKLLFNKYLFYYFILRKDEFYINLTKGGLQPFLSLKILNEIDFPLPPLHEQEQIVAKLEELMAFCDSLEQSIKESQGYNEKLLQQVLREALQPQ
ncbi:restriction endonuclease subunit S [Flavobacterium sp. UBA6195]|uniref:restriction endonuclease subunit S n=1 Tax=Flavobacterium sp. UBA6195 TaxID=1946554 RepID=UPI0025C17713|nr:restriction endonuclease subunit S [Flavobacterium sp. UBA6195]